tara:strand:- start:250 stop:864 length:615 start_codon:yes stop_codon:yes gene_type:complete
MAQFTASQDFFALFDGKDAQPPPATQIKQPNSPHPQFVDVTINNSPTNPPPQQQSFSSPQKKKSSSKKSSSSSSSKSKSSSSSKSKSNPNPNPTLRQPLPAKDKQAGLVGSNFTNANKDFDSSNFRQDNTDIEAILAGTNSRLDHVNNNPQMSSVISGKLMTRASTRSLLVKDWKILYFTFHVHEGQLTIYRNPDDMKRGKNFR